LITPIGFGDKVIKLKRLLGFSLKLFFKGFRASFFKKSVITLGLEDKFFKFRRCLVFDQIVLQKGCSQAFFENGCDTTATPVDRAEHIVARVFA